MGRRKQETVLARVQGEGPPRVVSGGGAGRGGAGRPRRRRAAAPRTRDQGHRGEPRWLPRSPSPAPPPPPPSPPRYAWAPSEGLGRQGRRLTRTSLPTGAPPFSGNALSGHRDTGRGADPDAPGVPRPASYHTTFGRPVGATRRPPHPPRDSEVPRPLMLRTRHPYLPFTRVGSGSF